MRIAILLFSTCAVLAAAEARVDPTWLYRHLPSVAEKKSEISTSTCHYHPAFGAGDSDAQILRGIARFGEVRVSAGGACEPAVYPAEEQIYVVMEGEGSLTYGDQKQALRKNDFFYVAPGARHAVSATGSPLRAVIMGYRIPSGSKATPPAKLLIANMDDVKKEVVGNHPPSTLYQLLVGDAKSTRDRIAAGQVVTSLFIMNFTPGGTNHPHHHDREEEIYLLMDGTGDMVAGGGRGRRGRPPRGQSGRRLFRPPELHRGLL